MACSRYHMPRLCLVARDPAGVVEDLVPRHPGFHPAIPAYAADQGPWAPVEWKVVIDRAAEPYDVRPSELD